MSFWFKNITDGKYGHSVWLIIAFIIGASLVLDSITPLGYAVWLFYLVAILLTALVKPRRAVYGVAGFCTFLIVIGFFLSPSRINLSFGVVNRTLGIGALWLVTILLERHKREEQLLRESEEHFRTLVTATSNVVYRMSPDWREMRQLRGQNFIADMENPSRNWLSQYIHPEDQSHVMAVIEEAIRSKGIFELEHRVLRVDGTLGWTFSRAIPLLDEKGEIFEWFGAASDITERKHAEEALQQSEERYRTLFDTMTEGFCVLEVIFDVDDLPVDLRVEEINSAFETQTGWHDAKGKRVRDLLPDLEPYWFEIYAKVALTGEPTHFENWAKPLNRWFQVSAYSVGKPGRPKVAVVFKDITEHKAAEDALKMSEATLKLAIETAGLGIFEWDIGSGKHRWSDIAKEHHGLSSETQVDHALFLSGVHPDDREPIERAITDAIAPGNGIFNVEYRAIGQIDRKTRWLTARGKVLLDDNGEPLRMVGACLDITRIVETEKALKEEISQRLRAVEEMHKQEKLLIRQGRLAAMGEMIANIAHQWRQPLNTLGLIIQELPTLYKRDLLSKEYLEASVGRAMQVINYMSKTIDGFRNFFSSNKEKEGFRVQEVLVRTVSMLENAFANLNLRIEVVVDDEVEVFGYPNEFSQVILNILVNARDAIIERKVPEPKVTVHLFSANDRAVLTIADNAGGIAPEILDKVFDPYFTTKGPEKGTGIGLFMSKTIIEKNMNGRLTVRNTEVGAEFRIEVELHGGGAL